MSVSTTSRQNAEKVDLYDTYVSGADRNDRNAFNAHLIGGLLASVDIDTARALFDAAAAFVNRHAAGAR